MQLSFVAIPKYLNFVTFSKYFVLHSAGEKTIKSVHLLPYIPEVRNFRLRYSLVAFSYCSGTALSILPLIQRHEMKQETKSSAYFCWKQTVFHFLNVILLVSTCENGNEPSGNLLKSWVTASQGVGWLVTELQRTQQKIHHCLCPER